MGIFSRSSNLEATKSALEKAQAKRDALRARAQAAVDALLAAGIAIDTAQVAAVEAVERGEQPQSIEKLKAALREAQHVEQASAKALSFAENQLQDAELAHQRAVNADARDRQRAQAARTLEALRLLAAEHGKGQAI